MNEFERPMPKYRLVATHRGDDLPTLAAREVGDANRWPELVWLNKLSWPYITDDPARERPGVLLSGALLKVPAPLGVHTDDATRGQVFERDCAMTNKLLDVNEDGDIAVFAGADNLRQQIKHRIDTPRGQARRHPAYGCLIWRLVGKANGPTAGLMGAEYVRAALKADYRVARVDFARAEVIGDSVRISARAVAVDGGIVDLLTGT